MMFRRIKRLIHGFSLLFFAFTVMAMELASGCISTERAPYQLPSPTATLVPAPVLPTSSIFTPPPGSPPATPLPAGAVEVLVFPEDGVDAIVRPIETAHHSILVTVYLLSDPRVIQALQRAAVQGRDVRVLLERSPYGGGEGHLDVASKLQDAGVRVQWGNPVFRYTHQKTLIIDNAALYVLTGNLTVSSLTNHRDFAVRSFNSADIKEAREVFEADWNRTGIDLDNSRLIWSPENGRRRIGELLESAQRRIDLQEQSLQDEQIINILIRELRRGIEVRLLSSPQYPLSDDPNEPGRQRLREAGAHVRYLRYPFIHAKVFIIDGRLAYIGSHNLTPSSLDMNREVGIVVKDLNALARVQNVFQSDWEAGDEIAFPQGSPAPAWIDHTRAADYLYQVMTVQLTVRDTYNSGRVIWLMGNRQRDKNFKTVIFPRNFAKWPESPDLYYNGKTIRVTGLIELYRGWPEIIVEDPSQIKIVD